MSAFEHVIGMLEKDNKRKSDLVEPKNVFLKYHTATQTQLDEYLINSCIFNDFEHIKYLLNSLDLKIHANIHTNKDTPFEYLLGNESKEIISYLIFECNLEKTNHIRDMLLAWPTNFTDEVDEMFKVRNLSLELKNNLSINDIKAKKNKV